jgi:hypothetical protein
VRTIRIEVTAEDIATGKMMHGDECPVALALRRETGVKWLVGSHYTVHPDDGYKVDLPPIATDFVYSFDRELPVEPFSFEWRDA